MQINHPDFETQLQNIVENAPFAIGIYRGYELRIEIANKSMVSTWGMGYEMIGKLYTDILRKMNDLEILTDIRSVLETGFAYHIRNRILILEIDGIPKTHYFNYSFTPIYNMDGSIFGIINTVIDVTDLNISKKITFTTEEKLRLALEAADLGSYEIDIDSGVIEVSENFKLIWNFGDTITKETIFAKIHPEDFSAMEHMRKKNIQNQNISHNIRIFYTNQEIRWLSLKEKYLYDSSGKPITIIGIVKDITDQKKSNERLEELVEIRTRNLQRSNEDLMQFAHVISHDLKEPLRKVCFFSNILESKYSSKIEEQGQLYIKKVEAAADRMACMIDGILMYSSISATGYKVEEIDLNIIIENIMIDLELIIKEKRAIISKNELPIIEGFPILLHQLFYNLINNALKFCKAEQPPKVIINSVISSIENRKMANISISDNGIGFDQNYSDKIFKIFERLHPKDSYDGTGLGLALCKKIVERHNGKLSASGRLNKGADFSVCLPLTQLTEKL